MSNSQAQATAKVASTGTAGQGDLYIIAAPSGGGKTSLVNALLTRDPQLTLSVSHTTRKPRPGEVEGVHYFFKTAHDFDSLVEQGELLEWAVVHGVNRYGTLRSTVEAAVAEGKSVLLEIDLQGARQVKEAMPEADFVFLAPPTWEELVRRLVGRGTESAEEQHRRLETAKLELAAAPEFDYVIVNDDVSRAAAALVELMGLTPHHLA